MHVLVVHSDPRFNREVKPLLVEQDASGAYQSSLSGIRHQVEAQFPDLIILERQCLLDNGQQLSQAFSSRRRLPVIFLTAASADHICVGEERTRLASMIIHMRSQVGIITKPKVIQVGQLRIHPGRMRVAVNGSWMSLPPIQFRILHHLAVNTNELVPHRELMSRVWGYAATNEEARELLKVHIGQLRRRLGPEFRDYIQAVRGQGYVLVDPNSEE